MTIGIIVVAIIIARLGDLCLLYFSRNVTKHRVLIRGSVFCLVTVLLVGSILIGNDVLTKTAKPEQIGAIVEGLVPSSKEATYRQLNSISLEKQSYLKGKRVATIGDSITELDGKIVTSVGEITGYQEALRRVGATVMSYGYSGATYALYDKDVSSGTHRSLYQKIVTEKVDFKDVDVVTLFGGTNDVGRGYPLGKVTDTTAKTTLGGLRGMIDYIQENNPNCRIFIFTPIERSDKPEVRDQMIETVNSIVELAEEYGLANEDLLRYSGITQANQGDYLYDKLHPNSDGMALIGQEMVQVIETKWVE